MTAARLRSIFGALILCAGLCTVFVSLGQWQWRVAFADQHRVSGHVSTTAVPLNARSHREQWLPRASIGALVRATGRFDDSMTFITEPRPTSRGRLPWVVSALRLDDGTAIGVVVGFTDAHSGLSSVTRLGSDPITFEGRLQPSEDSPAVGAWQPDTPSISTYPLVDRWSFPVLRDGYIVVTQSLTMNSLASPTPRFTSAPSASVGWRSVAYAFQWWSFAAFTLFVFIRQVATRPQEVTDAAAQ